MALADLAANEPLNERATNNCGAAVAAAAAEEQQQISLPLSLAACGGRRLGGSGRVGTRRCGWWCRRRAVQTLLPLAPPPPPKQTAKPQLRRSSGDEGVRIVSCLLVSLACRRRCRSNAAQITATHNTIIELDSQLTSQTRAQLMCSRAPEQERAAAAYSCRCQPPATIQQASSGKRGDGSDTRF